MIVLDTHIWVWWINERLDGMPSGWVAAIESAPRVSVSAVSCFEVALAVRRGRLELPLPTRLWIAHALDGAGVELLAVTPDIACRAVDLSEIHRDPFDRIIAATTLEREALLMSVDSNLLKYPELGTYLFSIAPDPTEKPKP